MLRVGLTGGIGSGKSTVAARLAERGAVLADADVLAREVVAPGERALTEIRDRFGDGVIAPDGSLDRPALGAIVFADESARHELEAITHPRIAERTVAIAATVPRGGVFVHDIPLLVEGGRAADYHLVVVVGADGETRVHRLVTHRGMAEPDARARIAVQADDEARRAAADVWVDNTGTKGATESAVDRLWEERLAPFAANLAAGRRAERPAEVTLHQPDPTWPAAAERLLARVRGALGERFVSAEHVGSTAVPGLPAKDVLDLQLAVRSLTDADEPAVVDALRELGHPRRPALDHDRGPDGSRWPKRFHAWSDPGRPAHVHVREIGSPGWRWALLFRDWLRADEQARTEYAALKARVAREHPRWEDYARAKGEWFPGAHERAEDWAGSTGWQPR